MMIAPPFVCTVKPLLTLITPSPLWLEVFWVDPERDQRTAAPPFVVKLAFRIICLEAFRVTRPVVEEFATRAPPMVTSPEVAVA